MELEVIMRIVRIARVVSFNVIHLSLDFTYSFFFWRLGKRQVLALLFAWETVCPDKGPTFVI